MTPIEVKNSLVGVLKGGSKETPTKETLEEFFYGVCHPISTFLLPRKTIKQKFQR